MYLLAKYNMLLVKENLINLVNVIDHLLTREPICSLFVTSQLVEERFYQMVQNNNNYCHIVVSMRYKCITILGARTDDLR